LAGGAKAGLGDQRPNRTTEPGTGLSRKKHMALRIP
jgi:hypothetical protein